METASDRLADAWVADYFARLPDADAPYGVDARGAALEARQCGEDFAGLRRQPGESVEHAEHRRSVFAMLHEEQPTEPDTAGHCKALEHYPLRLLTLLR